jgi:outer membrane protein OmpA-like peptidoglycan-associated protein
VDKALEARLSLHSVYFPTGQPPVKDPNAGLLPSQQRTLTELAADYLKYIQAKPDAHLILEGHADPRGSAEFNQALSERRVARVKSFLVEHGVPENAIETKALGAQHNLTADEVKASLEADPQVTKEEKARTLRNMKTIILASNRRVDVRLSTTGEVSTRQFPFNAEDALTLIGGRTKAPAAPARKKAAPKKKK